MIHAQIIRSIETIEIDQEMDLPTNRMETGEKMETFFVLHGIKGESFHKIVHTASQVLISPKILLSADLTIDLRLFLRLTNKNSQKTISKHNLIWSVSPQPTIPLTDYQTSVR